MDINGITLRQFHEAEGVEDWRVVGDGVCAFFRTGSFAAGVRLVRAIGELAGLGDHQPDVDLRHDGVTVRLLTVTGDWYGLSERDLELARQISALAREQGVPADPSMVQSVQVSIDALGGADVLPFWRAVLGYEYRPDSPDEDLVDPRGRGPRSGSSRWTPRVPSATASTSTSGSRTSWPRRGSRRPSPPAAAC